MAPRPSTAARARYLVDTAAARRSSAAVARMGTAATQPSATRQPPSTTEAAALAMYVPCAPSVTPGHPVPGALAAGGDADPRQQVTLANCGLEHPDEELLGRNRPLAAHASDRHRRPERDEKRREVVRRVVHADVAAERPAVSHLDVGHGGRDLGEDRPRHVHLGGADQRGQRRHGADLERRPGDGDRAELVEPREVDEHVGRGGPLFHHVDQRLAACERTRPVVLGEQGDRLVDGGRTRVGDLTQQHADDSFTPHPVTCQGA